VLSDTYTGQKGLDRQQRQVQLIEFVEHTGQGRLIAQVITIPLK
jgi:hypothetical protein